MADDTPPRWWPHRERSEFPVIGPLRWHIQRFADGKQRKPLALLLHGTGSSAHSWRHLAPALSTQFDVLAPDLPGHAFTNTPSSQPLSLPAVAAAVQALVDAEGRVPTLIVGHSAGAAVAAQWALDLQKKAPGSSDYAPAVVAINGAFQPWSGPPGSWLMPVARVIVRNPLVGPAVSAWASTPTATRRLMAGTGSTLDALGQRCYAELVARPAHVAGALRLMASWQLEGLSAQLSTLQARMTLIAAQDDPMVPIAQARSLAQDLPGARLICLERGGHLVHEEDSATVAEQLLAAVTA
jgi:magnesium chelatase accessory protein